MTLLPLLPILIPLGTAIVSLLLRGRKNAMRRIGVAGTVLLLMAAIALLVVVRRDGIQVVQVGGWVAPFGISIVVDLFSAIMVLMAAIMGFLVCIYSLGDIDKDREKFGYYPFYHFLLMGICGTFITGDIFNLYVWFEVMLLSSFILLTLGGERGQMEGAIKYVSLNLLSSSIFLAALGLLYGVSGTLNMADLAVRLHSDVPQVLATTVAMLFMVAFGIKAALFPLFFWLPASYHTPPVAVTAIFSGLLTKVGVYSLVRVFTLLFTQEISYTHTILLVFAGLTMVTGVLGAVAQNEIRRLLSFHIISQIGYLLMGLGIYTTLALTGVIFFMVHVIFAKSALFLVSGIAGRMKGTFDLNQLGGLYRDHPVLSALFLIAALSLAGLPPFSGFFAKLILVEAGMASHRWWIVGVALGTGFLTLFSMTKIWTMAFWKPKPQDAPAEVCRRVGWTYWTPLLILVVFTVLFGLGAQPLLALSEEAARQLMDPQKYIHSVLGAL